ncbi:MAG: hypothetical protein PHW15_01065 [Patescibacteria group bacterium]|jgi:hypothetical protein|nr:hypothetical protein [Patescibacteria group bacterium]MDD5172698.1 hypothetical protein [Patescibacteria group bacterium]
MFKENFSNRELDNQIDPEKKEGLFDSFLQKPPQEQIKILDDGLEEIKRIHELEKRGLLVEKKRPKVIEKSPLKRFYHKIIKK